MNKFSVKGKIKKKIYAKPMQFENRFNKVIMLSQRKEHIRA